MTGSIKTFFISVLLFQLAGCGGKNELVPTCGPYGPIEQNPVEFSDPEHYDTIFYAYQHELEVEMPECYTHSVSPFYTLEEGSKTVFMYYFYFEAASPEDVIYERTLVFEAPLGVDKYYIGQDEFCEHMVYLKGVGAFGVINDELTEGEGCISIEKVENTSDDAYEVNINLPIRWHNDSTSQLQFTEVFQRNDQLHQ